MIRIGFILPSSRANREPFRNQPLVEFYLLTILEKHFGEKVQLSLIDLRGIEDGRVLYHIPDSDIFLYSVSSPDFTEIASIVKSLRSIYSKAKHIAGGAHINLFPKVSAGVFDTIVLGEGEEAIIKVINDILSSSLRPIYKQEQTINIGSYPYPLRKYLPKTAISGTGLLGGKYFNLRATTVLFSRGCPFSCYFCAGKNLMFGPVRFRPPELIEEEIKYLKREYQVEALALKDDNSIPVDLRIAKPFLEAIGRTGVKWRGQSRANGVHPDMVKLAKEAGCVDIALGIESVSQDVLNIINKRIDLQKAKDYIKLLNNTGIGVRLNLILGLPGEPDDIVKQTLDFINEACPSSVLLNLFCPMPGSEIYHNPQRFGIKIKNTDWGNYHTVFGRFELDEQVPPMVFSYDEAISCGKGRSEKVIINNYIELQTILRERDLNF